MKYFLLLKEEKAGALVETDEKWLFFLLAQLVHNAVKYSAGKSNQLVLSLYERSGELVLEVKDFNGVGVPVSVDRKRIFNKFYTGENGRNIRSLPVLGLVLW